MDCSVSLRSHRQLALENLSLRQRLAACKGTAKGDGASLRLDVAAWSGML